MSKSDFPAPFKSDCKDSLVEKLFGGIRKDLLTFDHPLNNLSSKGVALKTGGVTFDLDKKELTIKDAPYELKLTADKGEVEGKYKDYKAGLSGLKSDGKLGMWLAASRKFGILTLQQRGYFPSAKTELGLKASVSGVDCAADMVFESVAPPKSMLLGASYLVPLSMPLHIGAVAKAKGLTDFDLSMGVFSKLPKTLTPGFDSLTVGAEMQMPSGKDATFLAGSDLVVDKLLAVKATAASSGIARVSMVSSHLGSATCTAGVEMDLMSGLLVPGKFGIQIKLK